MAYTEVFPLDIVRKNSLQIYQIEVSNWGNSGASADANSVLSPRLETALYGVAIDPDSDFDRVDIVPSVTGGVPSPRARDRLPVTKDSMLAGRFSFPRIRDFDGGFFLRCPTDLRYGDTYIDTDGTLQTFGRALASFSPPTLRAILYIDALTAPPSLPSRPPKNFTHISDNPLAATPFLVVPIYGRKRLRVTGLYTGADNPHVITLNGVAPLPNTAFPITTMSLVPNTSQSVVIPDPACNFLVVKSEADINPDTLSIQIQALD